MGNSGVFFKVLDFEVTREKKSIDLHFILVPFRNRRPKKYSSLVHQNPNIFLTLGDGGFITMNPRIQAAGWLSDFHEPNPRLEYPRSLGPPLPDDP